MTPEEIKALRNALGRSRFAFSQILGASEMSVARWEKGESRPLPVYLEKLQKLKDWVGRQG